MIQLNPHPAHKLPEAPAPAPPPAPPEPGAETALLVAQLRRSLGQSPQLDQALGQLISLLA